MCADEKNISTGTNKMKKKIMHILNSSSYSGAEKVVITIIQFLAEKYDFCYVSPAGSIEKQLNEKKIKYYSLEKLSVSNIDKVIEEFKPDIIHAHDCRASVYSWLCSKKIPFISHLHKNDPRGKKWGMYSISYFLSTRNSKRILLVSKSILEEAVFASLIKNKTRIIGNPIVNIEYDKNTKRDIDLLFLGRLTEAKDPLRFIQLVWGIKQIKSNIVAVMVGHGELYAQCKKRIYELQLEDTIKLEGFIEEPQQYLNRSKIMLMPSKWEGFGLSAVEAFFYAIPVITTKVGGLKEIVNNYCGQFCESDVEFIKEIIRLLEDGEYYKYKSINALQRAKELNNIESYMEKLQSIYEKL